MKILVFLWLGLLPLFCWGGEAALPAGGSEVKVTAEQLYRQGRASLDAGRYSEAIRSFKRLIDGFPADPLVRPARKYRAIAASERKKAAVAAATQAQGADRPREKIKPVLQPLYPAQRLPAEVEQAVPPKGDPANCRPHRASSRLRVCNWYDALAYCEGGLPSVIQLQELNFAECPAGKHDGICGSRIWSSEGSGACAKTVITGNGGEINCDKKTQPNIFVLCAGPAGN
ncbi:MAG: hypothetical protein PHV33_08685 [Elusimicrobiales bacterium]|nr:hypothetical protein [Elusimicrobiales bacterium]